MTTRTKDPHHFERTEYSQWLADPANANAEDRARVQAALDRLPPAPGAAAAPASDPHGWERAFAACQTSPVQEEPTDSPTAMADDCGWAAAFARAGNGHRG